MPRKEKQYHFIYKTVNLINGQYYIGMHSTNCLEDDYIGSGMRLWYSIKKYGRENFKKEILEFLPDRKTLDLREEEIVTKEIVSDPMCLNLKTGGQKSPGTLGKKYSEETRKKMSANNARAMLGKHHTDEVKKQISKHTSISKLGHIVSEETREKISSAQMGNEYAKGHILSNESKKKMSDTKKQRGVSDKQREFLKRLHESNKKLKN